MGFINWSTYRKAYVTSFNRSPREYDTRQTKSIGSQLDKCVDFRMSEEEKQNGVPKQTIEPNPWDKKTNPTQWANIQRILDIMNGVTSSK